MARRTNIQIIEDKRAELTQALSQNNAVISTLAPEQQEKFRKNFLEFASQEYLLSVVEPKEIIRFAVNVTKLGLDIAPSSNEVYIIPFDTKINGQKVMLPQAIIPYNGMQQLAYQSGFMLTVDPVYQFSENECAAARELSRVQQSKLNTADPKWLDKHFIGYDVVLKDLVGNLGEQVYFVDASYVKAATKTNKDPRWSLSTWTHKAVRKAYKQFLVPRDRAIEKFEKLEHLNDEQLIDVDVVSDVKLTSEIESAVTSLGLGLNKSNGTAIVTGQTFGKDKMLKDLGFVYNNNQWSMEYEETSSTETLPQKKISPAKELLNFLLNNGLDSATAGKFVKDGLGLSSKDLEGCAKVLENKDALLVKAKEFLNPVPDVDSDDVEVPDGIF